VLEMMSPVLDTNGYADALFFAHVLRPELYAALRATATTTPIRRPELDHAAQAVSRSGNAS